MARLSKEVVLEHTFNGISLQMTRTAIYKAHIPILRLDHKNNFENTVNVNVQKLSA